MQAGCDTYNYTRLFEAKSTTLSNLSLVVAL